MPLIVLVGLHYARLLQQNLLFCQAPRATASTFLSDRLPMLPQRSLRHLEPASPVIFAQLAFINAAPTIAVDAAASGVIAASPRVLPRP